MRRMLVARVLPGTYLHLMRQVRLARPSQYPANILSLHADSFAVSECFRPPRFAFSSSGPIIFFATAVD